MNIKDSEVIQKHGHTSNVMMEMTRTDSRLVLDLATKVEHTGKSMQNLTILTLLYLPPSFLAVGIHLRVWILINFSIIS